MKVGIITVWDDENYGNRLQHYAVQETIKKATYGGEAVTIEYSDDCKSRFSQSAERFIRRLKAATTYRFCAQGKLKIERVKRAKNLRAFSEKHLRLDGGLISNGHIPHGLNEKYDFFVVGSDQVWNPRFNHATPELFLTFADKAKRIAYAPSFGISQLPDGTEKYFADMLSGIPHLSCREEAGSALITKLTGREALTLIDPTMMLTADEWLQVTNTQLPKNNYLLTYFLGRPSDEAYSFIASAAAQKGLEIVSLNDVDNMELYGIGIEDFLGYFHNAGIVVTNSFHGTVFSMLFRKPFVVFGREPMNSRIETLLHKFGQDTRKYPQIFSSDFYAIDYSCMDKLLEKERNVAISYLREAMGLKDGR